MKLKKWMKKALIEDGVTSLPREIESISTEELKDNFECHYNYRYPTVEDFEKAVANDYHEYPGPTGNSGAIFTGGSGEPFHVHDWMI